MIEKYGDLHLPAGIAVLSGVQRDIPPMTPEELLAQMDEAGIDQTILYAVEAPIVYSSNEYVASLCRRWPDRLIGFASAHPHDPNAHDILKDAVERLGLKGLKLHPPLQRFAPNDPVAFRLYETAARLDIPVVFHVGTTPFGSLGRLADANPLLVDDVAVLYPELRIALTHLGTLWHNEAFMVVEKNPNVFIDTAAYITEIPQILTCDLIKRIGPDKILFGTDFPMPYADRPHRMKDFVDCVAALPVSQELLEGFFYGNVQRLLKGNPTPEPPIRLRDLASRLGMNDETTRIDS